MLGFGLPCRSRVGREVPAGRVLGVVGLRCRRPAGGGGLLGRRRLAGGGGLLERGAGDPDELSVRPRSVLPCWPRLPVSPW